MRDRMDMTPPRTVLTSPPGLRPQDGRDLYRRGLLALRSGDADAAVGLLIAGLRRQPSHQGMRRILVRTLLAEGRFQQGLVQADACLAAAPDDRALHFARGTALHGLGEWARACATLTRAAALRSDHASSCGGPAFARADLDDREPAGVPGNSACVSPRD